MNTAVRQGAVIVVLVLLAACGSSEAPTSPTETSQPPAASPPPPPPATNFPPLSGSSRTFSFDHASSYTVSNYTKNSRFVLYDNGAFVLQYPSLGEVGYRGAYRKANGAIVFEWEGWSSAGAWGATGTLEGDSLTIQFNQIMQLTDFEDAVYVLVR